MWPFPKKRDVCRVCELIHWCSTVNNIVLISVRCKSALSAAKQLICRAGSAYFLAAYSASTHKHAFPPKLYQSSGLCESRSRVNQISSTTSALSGISLTSLVERTYPPPTRNDIILIAPFFCWLPFWKAINFDPLERPWVPSFQLALPVSHVQLEIDLIAFLMTHSPPLLFSFQGFFRRSVQKHMEYKCLRDGRCLISRVSRNRCQYCRFQQCVAAGMARDSVRYGRVPRRPDSPDSPIPGPSNGGAQPGPSTSRAMQAAAATRDPPVPSAAASTTCEVRVTSGLCPPPISGANVRIYDVICTVMQAYTVCSPYSYQQITRLQRTVITLVSHWN